MRDLFLTKLAEAAEVTDKMLDRLLTSEAERGEIYRPKLLVEAMRYAALSPGKRLRPLIVIETARLFHRHDEGVVRAAAAVECIHAYSLVHDDLPALDDDDVRRDRPTLHRQFGEATAILAGDALLTIAFDILADPAVDRDPLVCAAMVGALARAAGVGGMVGGQVLDIEGEGRTLTDAQISRVQAMKTGALFRFAAQAGAFLGHAAEEDRHRLLDFGSAFGRAFQIADDLIDVVASAEEAGKATGKDGARGKATLVASHGVAEARTMLALATGEAVQMLDFFGPRANVLAEAARYLEIGTG
ncbi:MAG: polyprenyl synthetase family protein [Bauldia sp.]